MATQTRSTIPSVGTYITDTDRRELFRIEAVQPKEGVVIENCRTCVMFMLTAEEYGRSGFRILER